jgi:uncharacterized protein YjbI with pentapeptide repeats
LWGWTEFGKKSGWEYLELLSALAIPIVLAAAGFWFTAQQDQRQQRTEKERAQAERTLQQQNTQDEALQAYLDQMSTLLLEKDLRNPKDASEAPTLARARTLTVLASLDEAHKRSVLQFLGEAYLIQDGSCSWTSCDPVISLQEANLEGVNFGGTYTPLGGKVVDLSGAILAAADLTIADLRSANLTDADLEGAVLRDADLRGAVLTTANLNDANLSGADLRGASWGGALMFGTDLTDADLRGATVWPSGAEMSGADLRGADLRGADLGDATLLEADLRGATLSRVGAVPFAVLKGTDLRNADLSNTDLTDADLRGANLSGANLSGTNLSGANLAGADLGAFLDPHGGDLRGANLEGAKGVTKEQLEAAESLEKATMPNGQKYEDWLESKDRGHAGGNSSSS